jgi:hypothetical protein
MYNFTRHITYSYSFCQTGIQICIREFYKVGIFTTLGELRVIERITL